MSARNSITLIGGLVEDPRLHGKNVLSMRIAVDYGSDDPENRTGYFGVKYFLDDTPNGKFVRGQFEDNKLAKGSQIAISGRIVQNRWMDGEDRRTAVNIIADDLTYVGRRSEDATANATSGDGQTPAPAAEVPTVF